MSTIATTDAQTDAQTGDRRSPIGRSLEAPTARQTKEQHYREGYEQEATRHPSHTDGCQENKAGKKKHTHGQTGAAETTLYADGGVPDGWGSSYDPTERLLDGRTRAEKYRDLWAKNQGVDGHTAKGTTYKDGHKSDPYARDRRRQIHALADTLRLSTTATERATELATDLDPRPFNFCGGWSAFALGVVVQAANEQHDILRLDRDALHAERERGRLSVEQLAQATSKVAKSA